VLSGYILTYVALGKNNSEYKILEMSIKRYPRLAIPTTISCLVALFTFYFFNSDTSELSDWIAMYGNFDYSLMGAIYSGALRSFFVGESLYNPVLWTMKIELLGSFIIFLICHFKTKKNKRVENSILLVGVVFLFAGANGSKTSLGVVAFLIGYLFYLYGREIPWITSTALFIAGLYLAGIHMESSSYSFLVYLFDGEDEAYKICNFLSGALIVYSVIYNSSLNALFSRKIFVFMGKISFSAYLVHIPVISTVGVCSFNFFHSFSFAFHYAALMATLISIFATCLVSIIYYKGVDHMGMRIANRFSKKVLASLDFFVSASCSKVN